MYGFFSEIHWTIPQVLQVCNMLQNSKRIAILTKDFSEGRENYNVDHKIEGKKKTPSGRGRGQDNLIYWAKANW